MEKPKLLIVAGPNGSGKTSVTNDILEHEWRQGCIYITLGDCLLFLPLFVRHATVNAVCCTDAVNSDREGLYPLFTWRLRQDR